MDQKKYDKWYGDYLADLERRRVDAAAQQKARDERVNKSFTQAPQPNPITPSPPGPLFPKEYPLPKTIPPDPPPPRMDKHQTLPPPTNGPFYWVGEQIGVFATWLVEDVWPFSAIFDLGDAVRSVGPKVRAVTALICGLILLGSTAGERALWAWGHLFFAQMPDNIGTIVALSVGAIIGWFLPDIVGGSAQATAVIIGVAIGLGIAGGGCWLVYQLIRAAISMAHSSQ